MAVTNLHSSPVVGYGVKFKRNIFFIDKQYAHESPFCFGMKEKKCKPWIGTMHL